MKSSLERLLKVAVYDQFWNMVRLNHSKVKSEINLPRDEAVALYAYTLCHPPLYKEINSALRNGETDNFLIKLLDSAINNLPIYSERHLYRWASPPVHEIEKLNNNEEILEKAYISTLKLPNQITMAEPDCMIFNIRHYNGRDISLFSDDFSTDIQEVILPRGSKFVKSVAIDDSFDFVIEQIE